ncbi:MAG: ferritin-like domain-containing protein [Frankiales bacterium]|nr:ferritin-like domain-containing protein [Frankiales bacterium]
MTDERSLLTALLEAAHATVYGYGVLGARLDGAPRSAALLAFDSHRARRDQLAARLRERGVSPATTEPAYDVAVADETAAYALAIRLEEGMSQRWRDLVGGTDDPALRALAVAGLTETAVRATQWRLLAGTRPATVALPGSG